MREDLAASLWIGSLGLAFSIMAIVFAAAALWRSEQLDPKIYTSSDGNLYQEIEKGVYGRVVVVSNSGSAGGDGPGATGDSIVEGYGKKGTDPGGSQAAHYVRVCNGEPYVPDVPMKPCPDPSKI